MPEHVDITDPELHEPKGAAAASAGQLLVADGVGGSSWAHDLTNTHGDAIIASNTTATAVTAAIDNTLATDSDYVKITSGWSLAHGIQVSLNVDELVFPIGGDYFITFWADVKVPLTNNFIGIKYAINDTAPYANRKIIAQSQSTSDYLNLAASGIVTNLSANDTLSMYIAATKTDNLIVQEAGLIAFLLHEN